MAKCQILPFREKSQVSGRDLAKQLPECHVSGKVGPKKIENRPFRPFSKPDVSKSGPNLGGKSVKISDEPAIASSPVTRVPVPPRIFHL